MGEEYYTDNIICWSINNSLVSKPLYRLFAPRVKVRASLNSQSKLFLQLFYDNFDLEKNAFTYSKDIYELTGVV